MSFRKFDTGCWEDPWFEALPEDGKLLFIYLWTNKTCNPAGMYRITKERVQFNCGISLDKHIEDLKPKVCWDAKENIVWVKNFFRHQRQNSKFSEAAVKVIQQFPCKFKYEFYEYNKDILTHDQIPPLPPINRTETEAEAEESSTVVEPHTNPISSDNGNRKEKALYLEAVRLTKEEYQKLTEKFGEPLLTSAIEILNAYIMSHGKKYKSHYHTLIGWPIEEARKKNGYEGEDWATRRMREQNESH
jgi:hypothetical protein